MGGKQFGFRKTRLRGMAKIHWKVNMLTPLTNLYLSCSYL